MSNKDIQTNFKLSADFNAYIMKHPEIAKSIPNDARIVFYPLSNPHLAQKNMKLAEKVSREEKKKYFKAIKTDRDWKLEPVR